MRVKVVKVKETVKETAVYTTVEMSIGLDQLWAVPAHDRLWAGPILLSAFKT